MHGYITLRTEQFTRLPKRDRIQNSDHLHNVKHAIPSTFQNV